MSVNKTAVILAAGRGSRLKELSLEQPKPMTEVHQTGILNNLIAHLISGGMHQIVVVTGYFADKLKADILEHFDGQAEFVFVENKIYDSTNNIYSLWLAADYLKNGFYLFEADVFCEYRVIELLLNAKADNVALLGKYKNTMNGTVVDLDGDGHILNMYLKRHQTEGFDFNGKFKTINFYKLSPAFVNDFFLNKLREHIEREDVNSYYELIIKEAIDQRIPFFGLAVGAARWWEIDTIEDLHLAEAIFNPQEAK